MLTALLRSSPLKALARKILSILGYALINLRLYILSLWVIKPLGDDFKPLRVSLVETVLQIKPECHLNDLRVMSLCRRDRGRWQRW